MFPLFSVLTPYGHLSINRALSSLRYISSGVLWVYLLFFLFVCLFLQSLSGRKDNLIFFYIIIFTFLETQSPSTSPPPSKYTSVPFLFFKLIGRLFFWSVSLTCNSNNLNIPGLLSPRSPHPLGMNTVSLGEDHCLSFQKVHYWWSCFFCGQKEWCYCFLCLHVSFIILKKGKKRRKLDRNLYEFNQYYWFQIFQLLWLSIQLFIFQQ